MSECHIYSLPDIATFSQGKQIAVKDQYHIKSDDLERFIRIVDFTSDWTQEPRYVLKDAKYRVSDSDIVMLRYGTPGKVFRGHTGVIANNMFKITPNENILNKDYLYWYLMQDSVFRLLMANQSSSTMPAISFKMLNCISVNVPDKKIQKKICDILNDLDKKIAVNRCICANLEAQAQALFKHWFIDFAPFKDGKFVESELGMIPEGWRVGTLEDLGKIICGKTPSKANKSYYGRDIPFIKIPDMHENVFILKSEDNLSIEGSNSQLNKMIPEFSIMVSCIATVGLVAMNVKPSHTNQQINTIVPFQSCYRYYVYENLKLRYKELLMLGSSGTTTYNVNTRTFSSLKVLVPELRVIEDFNNVIKSHFEKILNLYQESSRLSTLRDTLLPKLMSGEIKV